jgi:hypothetical protein
MLELGRKVYFLIYLLKGLSVFVCVCEKSCEEICTKSDIFQLHLNWNVF